MANKIYAFDDVGCKYETIHKEETLIFRLLTASSGTISEEDLHDLQYNNVSFKYIDSTNNAIVNFNNGYDFKDTTKYVSKVNVDNFDYTLTINTTDRSYTITRETIGANPTITLLDQLPSNTQEEYNKHNLYQVDKSLHYLNDNKDGSYAFKELATTELVNSSKTIEVVDKLPTPSLEEYNKHKIYSKDNFRYNELYYLRRTPVFKNIDNPTPLNSLKSLTFTSSSLQWHKPFQIGNKLYQIQNYSTGGAIPFKIVDLVNDTIETKTLNVGDSSSRGLVHTNILCFNGKYYILYKPGTATGAILIEFDINTMTKTREITGVKLSRALGGTSSFKDYASIIYNGNTYIIDEEGYPSTSYFSKATYDEGSNTITFTDLEGGEEYYFHDDNFQAGRFLLLTYSHNSKDYHKLYDLSNGKLIKNLSTVAYSYLYVFDNEGFGFVNRTDMSADISYAFLFSTSDGTEIDSDLTGDNPSNRDCFSYQLNGETYYYKYDEGAVGTLQHKGSYTEEYVYQHIMNEEVDYNTINKMSLEIATLTENVDSLLNQINSMQVMLLELQQKQQEEEQPQEPTEEPQEEVKKTE